MEYYRSRMRDSVMAPEKSVGIFAGTDGFVTMPESYRDYVEGKNTMINAKDLHFVDSLIQKHGSNKVDQAGGGSKRSSFFQASKEIYSYANDLRRGNESNDEVEQFEILTTSSDRMRIVSQIFLNHPEFKSTYLDIQREKLELAFPLFKARLQDDQPPVDSSDAYFLHIEKQLEESVIESAEVFDEYDREALGFVIGLRETQGCYRTPDISLNEFAVIGTGAFITLLQEVVDEAVDTESDIQTALRREFLHRSGIGFNLMRMNLFDFANDFEEQAEDLSMEERRTLLRDHQYRNGTCPAILKMLSDSVPGTKRPIVYEYAVAATKNFPVNRIS